MDSSDSIEANTSSTAVLLDQDARAEIKADRSSSLSPKFDPYEHIKLHYVRPYYAGAKRGRARTVVSEKRSIMQWRGEHFRCEVGITVDPSLPGCDWSIGLAQACDYITLQNHFGNGGYYAWEFHPLKSGLHRMINDSNGTQWPFYSDHQAMFDLFKGRPVSTGFQRLNFTDYFYPTMHWQVLCGGQQHNLTHVTRRQGFKVWLIAIKRGVKHLKDKESKAAYMEFDPFEDEVYVLKQMQWRYNIELQFDCHRMLGERCTFIDDKQEEQPRVFETIEPLPVSALIPPNCNSAQSLIFYPNNPRLPIQLRKVPQHTIVRWSKWVEDMTRGSSLAVGFSKPHPPPWVFPCYPGDVDIMVNIVHPKWSPNPAPVRRLRMRQ